MQTDKDRPLISSEAPELPNKALVIDGPSSLEGHEPAGGHGHDARRDCACPRQLGESGMAVTPSSQVTPGHSLDEPDISGLDKPGQLGEAIIPLSGQVAPHAQRRLQPPALQGPIKLGSPELSRAPTSGDCPSPAFPLDQTPSTMIFSDLYKSPRTTFTKFRNSFPHGVPPPADIDADLVSRDKTKNKEAVKKYLAEKIRYDWEFTWPSVVAASTPAAAEPTSPGPEKNAQAGQGDTRETIPAPTATDEDASRDPGEEADTESDAESDAESVYSTISEDAAHFRPRAEWTSDLSDNDEPRPPASPFRFDSPDAVGAAVRDSLEAKRARRRRAVREETKWNPGLACFEARRNAWTGARTVRVKPKPQSPVSPSSTRRLFWRHHRSQSSVSQSAVITSGSPPPTSPLQPAATRTSTTTASESDSGVQRTTSQESNAPAILYPVQTVIPIPPPLLPPQNPMRASVQPSMYGSLYDKVVVQSLQPSCPVNLADMLRACVVGWKRDGEWPPRPTYPAPAAVQTANAEALAMRQRKAQQQRAKNAANASAAATATGTAPAGRRLSFVGFFSGGHAASKSVTTAAAAAVTQEGKEKENALVHSQSHSDEGAGSSGKALFRRSLQRVFSLGQHGHAHSASNASANGAASGPLSPTSPPSTKEVTAAG